MLPVRAQRRLIELRRQLFRTYHVGRHVVDFVDHEVDGHGLQGLATERGGEPDLHPAAVLGVCLDGLRFVEGEADEVAEADAGEPSQICHGGFDAGLAREQVDVPRGTRVDGSGKHALTALQDKGRIRVAEDAAQQPVEVEAGDGAVGV